MQYSRQFGHPAHVRQELPAVMPSHHIRTPRDRVPHQRSVDGVLPGSMNQHAYSLDATQYPSMSVSSSMISLLGASGAPGVGSQVALPHLRMGLQGMLDRVSVLAEGDYDDEFRSTERELAGALKEQMQSQVACMDWLSRSMDLGPTGPACNMARTMAADAYREQRRMAPRFGRAIADLAATTQGLPHAPQTARLTLRSTVESDEMLMMVRTFHHPVRVSRPAAGRSYSHEDAPGVRPQFLKKGAGLEFLKKQTEKKRDDVRGPNYTPRLRNSKMITVTEGEDSADNYRPPLPVSPKGGRSSAGEFLEKINFKTLASVSKMVARAKHRTSLDKEEEQPEVADQDRVPQIYSKQSRWGILKSKARDQLHPGKPELRREMTQEERVSASRITRKVKTQVLVEHPSRRGISAGQLHRFFERTCGDVLWEEWEDANSTICLPTALAELCRLANRTDESVRNRTRLPRETNLYAVTDLIIKPETMHEGVSYAEMLNPEGLQIDFFISHHWAEDFGEFTQSILRQAVVVAPTLEKEKWQDVVYWCCAFANNQHGVELGDTLEESPFYMALSDPVCKGTVMNLNQAASSLDRIWCIYEVYLTHVLKKPFTLNFKLGPLAGVNQESKERDAWVMHIFKMLQHIDVRQAESTAREDYVKIMSAVDTFNGPNGTKGADALNSVVKAMLGSQAIFTLARRGETAAVKLALELGANPNAMDNFGLRPLTYAAGVRDPTDAHRETQKVLIEGGADKRASISASTVVAMWDKSSKERQRAIEAVRKLDLEETDGFNRQGVARALLEHTSAICDDLAKSMDAENAELRLQVVFQLRTMLQVLMEHSKSSTEDSPRQRKGQSQGIITDLPTGMEELKAVANHAKRLAMSLVDEDYRVRKAVVESLTCIGQFDLSRLKMGRGDIPKGHHLYGHVDKPLETETGGSVLHFAACQTNANALIMLATGVDWEVNNKPLRDTDAQRRNIAHLAVAKGHAECLEHLLGKAKLPFEFLVENDDLGRTTVHYAAEHGCVNNLLALTSLGKSPDGCMTTAHFSQKDGSGSTPVHIAASHGHLPFVAKLLSCGLPVASLKDQDGQKQNLAHILAAKGNSGGLRFLIEHCDLPRDTLRQEDDWYRTPAHVACCADAADVLRLLREVGAPLHLAMGPAEPKIGAVALFNKNDPGTVAYLGDAFQLCRVYYRDRNGKVKLENEQGIKQQDLVDPERCEFAPTPLEVAERLRKKGAEAALWQHWELIVAEGFAKKEEVLAAARRGELPISFMLAQKQVASLKTLIQQKALRIEEITWQDAVGRTSLHWAAASGDADILKAACTLGAKFFEPEDYTAVDHGRWTVLHHAAVSGDAKCMQQVIKLCTRAGGEIFGATDLWQQSPAHVAAMEDAADVLEILAKNGAPLHQTMGEPQLVDQTIVLVQERGSTFMSRNRGDSLSGSGPARERKSTSGSAIERKRTKSKFSSGSIKGAGTTWGSAQSQEDCDDDAVSEDDLNPPASNWSLGRIAGSIFADNQFTVKHANGKREACIDFERCVFAPTPLVLADRMGRLMAAQMLMDTAWRPFAEAVLSCTSCSEDFRNAWDWEEMEADAREGALPAGFLASVNGGDGATPAAIIKQLVSKGVLKEKEFLSRDVLGRSALLRAAGSGRAEVLSCVIALATPSNADIEALDLTGRGLLHYAAMSNNADTVRTAVKSFHRPPQQLGDKDSWGCSPAHLAVELENVDALQALITLGVPVNEHAGPHVKLEIGAIVLVRPLEKEDSWQLGLVRDRGAEHLKIKYRGGKEEGYVDFDRCCVAPTPLVLAEKLRGHQDTCVAKLRDVDRKNKGNSAGMAKLPAITAARRMSHMVSSPRNAHNSVLQIATAIHRPSVGGGGASSVGVGGLLSAPSAQAASGGTLAP
ncbi:unnamed protein product [Polarella glacialis]|uniref:PARP n=1 Tax=Polarella glacialis TaxID=89957 RepID=A0A813FK55_POLGL|nr:unnamed protein product [Polarella glacialis]